MKRTARILALVLLFAMAITAMFGCNKTLSGSYEHTDSNGTVSLIVFDGEEFTYSRGSTQLKGVYEIKKSGDKQLIVLMYDETVTGNGKANKLDKPLYIGSEDGNDFVQGDGYITIGSGSSMTRYKKK